VGGSSCEVSLCEGAVSRAEGFARFSHWRIREVRSDTPDRLDKRSNSPTAGRASRSSESTVSPLKQSDKGFVACARRIATLQVKIARESTRKGCMASVNRGHVRLESGDVGFMLPRRIARML
jgi:hypothetical protein